MTRVYLEHRPELYPNATALTNVARRVPLQFDRAMLVIDQLRAGIVHEIAEFMASRAPKAFVCTPPSHVRIQQMVDVLIDKTSDMGGFYSESHTFDSPLLVSGVKHAPELSVYVGSGYPLSCTWIDYIYSEDRAAVLEAATHKQWGY